MSNSEIKTLLQINDRVIAEEIQRVLEESNIYSLLKSDDPAASITRVYIGSTAADHITIMVNELDYNNAVLVMKEHGYEDLIA